MKFGTQPTEQRYHLKCKVLVKKVSYMDYQSKGETLITEDFVFLIPQESTQRSLFMGAWLPDTLEGNSEIGLEIGRPVEGHARACLRRKNKIVPEAHIFVMSRGAEELIKDWARANRGFLWTRQDCYLDITVLAENEDELLDQQKDFDLVDKKRV
jgi:hypothetical protein